MDPKWIQVLLVLVFYQKTAFGIKEGEKFTIKCRPTTSGTMIIWFRVLDKSGMEFLASLSNNGVVKASRTDFTQIFSHSSDPHVLTLNSFKNSRDSGIYTCGSLYKGNQLIFGNVTRLSGEKPTPAPPTVPPVTQATSTTPSPCECKGVSSKGQVLSGTSSPSFFCTPIILGPLAGGCGLLLLLLLITTIYCNRIRTRRCPHHYKRKPRAAVPEKQMMVNRHV
ncbi:T-cell surface glycoprotein CD8 alpha chain [Mugil cephalus]|uniref:T-cell surface glycoprotein CD8 alpha chain n=1 Tax=Mugil cephalus TaxID=48193 RepID=UPI001FB618D7|nr:T-cell surface glycoprotein CD8 alpha chain [Mugil cephalus]